MFFCLECGKYVDRYHWMYHADEPIPYTMTNKTWQKEKS